MHGNTTEQERCSREWDGEYGRGGKTEIGILGLDGLGL